MLPESYNHHSSSNSQTSVDYVPNQFQNGSGVVHCVQSLSFKSTNCVLCKALCHSMLHALSLQPPALALYRLQYVSSEGNIDSTGIFQSVCVCVCLYSICDPNKTYCAKI